MTRPLPSSPHLLVPGMLLATGLALAGAAGAQAPPPAQAPKAGTALVHGELALSLSDAIAMALENNLDVEIQRHAPFIAEERADGAWGAYDPDLFADWTYADIETPNANPLFGVATLGTQDSTGRGGLRGLVPRLGAQYEISYEGSAARTSSGFPDLNPEYRTGVEASVRVPVLRDFLWGASWFQVKSTRLLSDEALQGFRQALMDTVFAIPPSPATPSQGIEAAYWNLVATAERLRVAEKSVETARALREQTGTQYEVGVVSKVEVVESDAGVAQREFDRITAENAYRRAQDRLIDLVLGRNLQASSRLLIHPTDSPEPIPYDVDPDRAKKIAFELRPELAIARHEIERLEIQRKFARNQRLPQLDLVGSYGNAGLAGRTNPIPFPLADPPAPRAPIPIGRRYSDTDDDFFSGDAARQWTAGASLSFPIGNRRARADHNVAGLELRRARTRLMRAEQDVILEVRDAIRNLTSAQDGIAAADARRRATQEQLRAERIRLENGESTPFDVLDREEDLVESESQRITALQIYRNSLAELDRAQGTILRNRNVVVDRVRALR